MASDGNVAEDEKETAGSVAGHVPPTLSLSAPPAPLAQYGTCSKPRILNAAQYSLLGSEPLAGDSTAGASWYTPKAAGGYVLPRYMNGTPPPSRKWMPFGALVNQPIVLPCGPVA